MYVRYCIGMLLLCALLLTACNQQPNEAERPFQVTPVPVTALPFLETPTPGAYPYPYPAPAPNTYPYPYPYPAPAPNAYPYPAPEVTGDPFGRAETALASLTIAQQIAVERFAPNAQLYAILPSRTMLINLGSPPARLGWFYLFKTSDSSRELIVQIVDGRVSGTTEIEVIEPELPLQQAIPLDRVTLDSDEVFTRFAARGPELNISIDDPRSFDLELVNLESGTGPVWSVYDPNTRLWLFALDAATGAEVPNPRR